MNWKKQIKKDLRQRVRENPTPRHAEIAEARGQSSKVTEGECKVNPCEAITCIRNENRQCVLAEITITQQGRCAQYIKRGTPMK